MVFIVCSSCGGSSPLARGLPARSKWGLPFVWIIPARAGFTIHPRGAGARPADHPRSRGVYPIPNDLVQDQEGIIPARAGFTGLLCE